MNRLQKKCLIASVGAHSLLLLILLVGPAFLTSKSKSEDSPVIDFIPSKFIDGKSSGGNRNAKPPPVVAPPVQPPPQPQPQPVPEKRREPDPPKDVPKIQKPDPEAFEAKTEPKQHKPQVNTTIITRKSNSRTPPKTNSDAQEQERQMADVRQKMAKQVTNAARSLRDNATPATTIESSDYGPGGGGPAAANYAAWVKSVYENAWEAPEDAAKDNAITKITVTIASDGMVVASHITQPSGDSHVDRSVQRTIDRVTFIGPFPEGVKEKQRTYIINFNLKAKRGLA